MGYMVEAGASSSRRARRRRALITLVVVALLLFSAFWYAYSYYRESSSTPVAQPSVTATCTARPKGPTPASTVVNVYNSTQRSGLAAATAKQVRQRGFAVSTVSNDPLQKTIAGPAEVRFGTAGATRGALVLTLVKGATVVHDARTDQSVDLVLGQAFTALAPPPRTATPAKGAAPTSGGC